MKKTLTLLVAAAALIAGCGKKAEAPAPELTNLSDTLSYYIGTIIAADACYSGLSDYSMMAEQAIEDVANGNVARINQMYAYVNAVEIVGKAYAELDQKIDKDILLHNFRGIVANYKDSVDAEKVRGMEKTAQEYIASYIQNKMDIYHREFMAGVDKIEGIRKTESGIRYIIDKKGTAIGPKDDANVKYVLKDYNGNEIDSSTDGKFKVTRPANVILGFAEAVDLAGFGGKIRAWVPSDLGYGDAGTNNILPGQTLVFEIEVLPKK